MSTADLLRRPFLVSLVALFPTVLALWYVGLVLWGGALWVMQLVQGGASAALPADVQAAPLAALAVEFVVVILALAAGRGLRRGAGWSRFATPLLALFAFPPGYPYDLVVVAAVALLLFLPPGPRAFFGKRI